MSIDTIIQQGFISVQSQASLQIFSIISWSLYAIILVAFAYLIYKKDKNNTIKFIVGGLLLYAMLEVMKIFTGRMRPDLSGNDSFPSRHAGLSFFVAGFLPIERKYKILFYVWAILISISRLALNLHWFTDVLIGSIIGLAFAFLIEKAPLEKLFKRSR
jgi:membrane-associated phospholipid phosphatase